MEALSKFILAVLLLNILQAPAHAEIWHCKTNNKSPLFTNAPSNDEEGNCKKRDKFGGTLTLLSAEKINAISEAEVNALNHLREKAMEQMEQPGIYSRYRLKKTSKYRQ